MRVVCLNSLFCFSLVLLSGCNVFNAAVLSVTPAEQVKAKYNLPDKPTLVVVDDPRNLVTSPSTLRRIAAATRNVLEVEQVIVTGGFVAQDELAGYREELGDRYNQTTLAGLAMHLGAKQVIHAEVTSFQMGLGGNVIRPAIALNVKVFDLDERGRVFPRDSEEDSAIDVGTTVYPLQSKLPAQDLTGQTAARSIAQRDLADQAGRDIARLFFDWRMPALGSGIDKPK